MRNTIGGNRRGVTLIEICIALLLLSIGLVSILALFPKALYSTRRAMEISTASSVARSALASLLVYTLDDGSIGDDMTWDTEYNGGSVDADWWPGAAPDDVSFTGTIVSLTASGASTNVRVSNIGVWETDSGGNDTDGDGFGWNDELVNYFLLMTSGRSRGRLCTISVLALNTDSSTDELITVPVLSTDLVSDGVRTGDNFRLVGPGCLGPDPAVELGDGTTLYSWVAVVCENNAMSLLESGAASSVSGTWLTDEDKGWVDNQYASDTVDDDRSYVLYISGGTGSPQWQDIKENTKFALKVDAWGTTAPIANSTYTIYNGSGGMHDVIFLVYGKNFNGSLTGINAVKPVYFFSASIWEP